MSSKHTCILSILFIVWMFTATFLPMTASANAEQQIGLGVAVQDIHLQDPDFSSALLQYPITYLTSESGMYIHQVWTGRGEYDFAKLDAIVDFSEEHNFHAVGHTLVVYKMVPDWFAQEVTTKEEAEVLLKEYVQTMAERYKGKVKTWHVVNEAVQNDNAPMVDDLYREDDFWLNLIGPEYVGLVFEWVHEVDPDANLYYTDFSEDMSSPKVDRILTLVENLKNENVPIDGVGLQAHQCIDDPLDTGCENKKPTYEQYKYFFDRADAIGLKSAITEMDVRVGNDTSSVILAEQADIFENAFRACLDSQNCERFSTWGFSDKYSWLDRRKAGPNDGLQQGLLFDENFEPKPAYNRIKALKTPVLGDLNSDQTVNLADYSVLSTLFGQEGSRAFTSADLDSDGKIDIRDYSLFITFLRDAWGRG